MAQSIDWTTIAKMVGVDMGEPFKIEPSKDIRQFLGDCGIEDDFYDAEFCIFENELIICNSYGHTYNYSKDVFISVIVGSILNGLITIKRKRCKPEDGDDYYYVYMNKKGYYIMNKDYMSDNYFDIMNYVNGNCFITREEALNAAKNMYKEFKDKIDSLDKNQYI